MSTLSSDPDVVDLNPAFVLLLRDGYTGGAILEGDVTVRIGRLEPFLQKYPDATFVFADLKSGSYTIRVRSDVEQPYYLPADIPLTIPLARPSTTLWPQPPIWPAYPDLVLADPEKNLDDSEQTAAYLAQRNLAGLQPSTSYPFPAGATLVRGIVKDSGNPLSGALVTTALLARLGQFPVRVVSADLSASNAQTLTVVSGPVIQFIQPASVVAGSADFTLSVTGTGFAASSVVELNGVGTPTTFVSAVQILARMTAAQIAAPGQLNLTARNPGPPPQVSGATPLKVEAAPVIDSIRPAAVTAGSADLLLWVEGSAFAADSVIELNGTALDSSHRGETHLSACIPSADLAAAGALSVTVHHPGPPPQNSTAKTLNVVAGPVIVDVAPAAVLAGGAGFTLAVEGSGFTAASVVRLNGAAVPTKFAGTGRLYGQLTAAQVANAGASSVTVQDPGPPPRTSNAGILTIVATLAIDSIEPSTVTADSAAFTLVVRGRGFNAGSTVEVDGSPLTTTFVSSEQLDAHVPRGGYTTGPDGAYVLFFDDIRGRTQNVTLIGIHPQFPKAKLQDVTVQRGATVSVDIDLTS
jgi:hypothetical protein